MLIIDVKKGNIEKALKMLKRKVIRTRLLKNVRSRKEFVKPSVKKRMQKQKAEYIQKIRTKEDQ
jgi:small subunit ribosomal protein S21